MIFLFINGCSCPHALHLDLCWYKTKTSLSLSLSPWSKRASSGAHGDGDGTCDTWCNPQTHPLQILNFEEVGHINLE